MGPAMKYRRVRPEPAGGDTKANRLRWFKEGLTKLASEDFRRVAFPPVWKSNSDLGYTESYCGDLLQPKRHRADAGMEATSRRWRGIYTPSSRCGYGDDVALMAWGARNLISTQVLDVRSARRDRAGKT